ncbi:hypothetical protein [uncultured Arcticibacterium sp.]|uniref:hypothetical protein n=1 Tax=uncultured Arcticibacterium sp. TaxID=2173042 RepID=UPI0030F5A9EA
MRLHIFILILCSFYGTSAQSISANSGWNANVSSSEISDAGLDYNGTYQSSQTETYVTASGFNIFRNYYVYVEKSELDWNSNLILSARRTGNGSGGWFGSISGGTNYIPLSNSSQLFYYGGIGFSNSRSNVPIQYQIEGLSVLLPAKTYTISVIYTVSD